MTKQIPHLLLLMAFGFLNLLQAQNIDLELTAVNTPYHPIIYTNYDVLLTLTNTGDQMATGVEVKFAKPAGVTYTGGNEYAASQGAFHPYGDEKWTVGSIPAGGSATLTVNYYLLQSSAPVAYAQVSAANEDDPDSTPDNGTPPIPNEDDEASTAGGPDPLPDLNGSLQHFIPPGNNCYVIAGQSVGFISIRVNNTGDVPATSFKVKFYLSLDDVFSGNDFLWSTETVPSLDLLSVSGPEFISPGHSLPNFVPKGLYYIIVTIDDENEVAELDENNNLVGPFEVRVGAPDIDLESFIGVPSSIAAGSSFNVDATVSFDDNGFGLDPSTNYIITTSANFNGIWETVGTTNYPISDFSVVNVLVKSTPITIPASVAPGTYDFRVFVNLNDCEETGPDNFQTQTITVSGGTGVIDLEMSMVQPNPTPAIYSNYEVVATVTNTGGQNATGVKVSFAKPTGVVYTGGNEFVASQGTFNPHSDEIWIVGSIPAGGSATLTVSYFLLQDDSPIAYVQVSAANETDVDSTPGNGTPPIPNEDDEASMGVGSPTLPDLILANLIILNSPVERGEVLTYLFDITNNGSEIVGDFSVKAWISTDPALSVDDVQDGIVPTGNFGAGQVVTSVPGASTVSSSLAPATYYLILKVDADNQVTESQEGNNTLYTSFEVIDTSPGCPKFFASGSLICASGPEAGEVYIQHIDNDNDVYEMYIDYQGNVVSKILSGSPPEIVLEISGDKIIKKVVDPYTILWTKTIPPALYSAYESFNYAVEFEGGFVLFAFETYDPNTGLLGPLYAIRTDDNLNPLFAKEIDMGAHAGAAHVQSGLQIDPDRLAITYKRGGAYSFPLEINLYVLDGNMNKLSEELLLADVPYAWAYISENRCGFKEYTLEIGYTYGGCPGVCGADEYRTGYFENEAFVELKGRYAGEFSTFGNGERTRRWRAKTADGGMIKGEHIQQVSSFPPTVIHNEIVLSKTLNNSVIWEKTVEVPGAVDIVDMFEVGSDLAFIRNTNNELHFIRLDCIEGQIPTDGVDLELVMSSTNPSPAIYSSTEVVLTINNTGTEPATGIIVEWIRPIGTVYTGGDEWTATQGSFNPHGNELWTVGSLPAGGSATITVNYYLLTANTLTPYAQVVVMNETDADSTPDNGSCCSPNEDDEASIVINDNFGDRSGISLQKLNERQRMAFDKIYPNPAKYWVGLTVFSKEDQSAIFDFYNQQGQFVHRMEVELKEGRNDYELQVSDWKTGTYNIIGRGNGTPAYGRFLKVWEE